MPHSTVPHSTVPPALCATRIVPHSTAAHNRTILYHTTVQYRTTQQCPTAVPYHTLVPYHTVPYHTVVPHDTAASHTCTAPHAAVPPHTGYRPSSPHPLFPPLSLPPASTIRSAMVNLLISSQMSGPPALDYIVGHASGADALVSASAAPPLSSQHNDPATCMFWCAVALGGLTQGRPIDSVSYCCWMGEMVGVGWGGIACMVDGRGGEEGRGGEGTGGERG